jgi:hypothetical protein
MEMREAAEAYCQVIESARGSNRPQFASDVARTLARAVAAAYELVSAGILEEGLSEAAPEPIPHERWVTCFADIASVLAAWDDYWTTLDAYRVDDATGLPDVTALPPTDFVVNLSLADALADIWRDLRQGLIALREGVPADNVAWEWRFSFQTHWGAHAVEALRAIHAQVTS